MRRLLRDVSKGTGNAFINMFAWVSGFSQTLCWTIPAGANTLDMVGVWVVVGGGKRTRTNMRALHGYHSHAN